MAKKKQYNSVREMVLQEFGETAIIKKYDDGVPSISTGSVAIDVSTGIGGIPLGRVTMIYGPEAGGKTTLSLNVVKNALDSGLKVLYIDTENSLDYGYVHDVVKDSYDEERLLIVQPETAEAAFMVAEAGIEGKFNLIIFDSIASVAPDEEMEKDFDDGTMMISPRLNGKFLRRNIHKIKANEIAFLMTNQVRDDIGSYFGGYSMPGGHALEHYTSLRIYISRSSAIENSDDEKIGNYVNFVIKKNKVGKPYRQATTNIIYGDGINKYIDIISFGKLLGVIKSRGSYFGFDGDTIGSKPGILNTADHLSEDQELLDKIIEMCYNVSGSKKNHISLNVVKEEKDE